MDGVTVKEPRKIREVRVTLLVVFQSEEPWDSIEDAEEGLGALVGHVIQCKDGEGEIVDIESVEDNEDPPTEIPPMPEFEEPEKPAAPHPKGEGDGVKGKGE